MLSAVAVTAWAEPAPPFAVLWRQVQGAAPRLREGEAQVRAAQGNADQLGALPNPTVGVEAENLGQNRFSIAPMQTTLSVSQPLELGGKRSARIASGRADVGAARAHALQAQADFAHDLALAYAAAEVAQAKASVLSADLDRAREDLRAARAQVHAGKDAEVRAIQAAAAESAAEADLGAANADAEEALAKLSGLAGVDAPFTGLAGSLLDSAATLSPPPADLTQSSPAVLSARADRDAAARKVQVERSRAAPDVTVMAGARRIDGLSSTIGVVGLSVPLPLFDRNKGATAAAAAELTAAEARLRSAELDAQSEGRGAVAQARSAAGRLSAAETGAKAAHEAYDLTRIGYDRGKLSLTDLLAARRQVNEAELRLIDARLARVRAEIELARIAGRIPFGG
jgi:cobalt-zinc-cadmium efflux system outer membrane protein